MENLKIYTDLSKVNVNDHVEKKNGLSYLTWSWAIDFIEKYCDEHGLDLDMGIDREVDKDLDVVKKNGMVHTYVSINKTTKRMWLPIMDFKNKSIEKPNSTDINKAYMRCLTKNISRWGLGMYIYSGEDLPQDDSPKVELISDSIWKDLNKAYNKEQIKEMYKELGITKGSDIPMEYAKAKIDAFLKDNSKMPVKEFY